MAEIDEKVEYADDEGDNREISDFEKAFSAADQFFSEKNIEQKTRLIPENKEGITELKAFDKYLGSIGLEGDPVGDSVADETMALAISIDGKGRQEIIEIANAINSGMMDAKITEAIKRDRGINGL